MKTICLFALALPLLAAEPDWTVVEPYALSVLQRYIQIPSINPPADTRAAAEFMKRESDSVGALLEAYKLVGLAPQLSNIAESHK